MLCGHAHGNVAWYGMVLTWSGERGRPARHVSWATDLGNTPSSAHCSSSGHRMHLLAMSYASSRRGRSASSTYVSYGGGAAPRTPARPHRRAATDGTGRDRTRGSAAQQPQTDTLSGAGRAGAHHHCIALPRRNRAVGVQRSTARAAGRAGTERALARRQRSHGAQQRPGHAAYPPPSPPARGGGSHTARSAWRPGSCRRASAPPARARLTAPSRCSRASPACTPQAHRQRHGKKHARHAAVA